LHDAIILSSIPARYWLIVIVIAISIGMSLKSVLTVSIGQFWARFPGKTTLFSMLLIAGLFTTFPAQAQTCQELFSISEPFSPSYETLLIPNARVIHDADQVVKCGLCLARVGGFFNSFMEPLKEYFEKGRVEPNVTYHTGVVGKFVLVFSRGQLVGLIKSSGEDFIAAESNTQPGYLVATNNPTFLALRNVKNSNDETVLKLGHLYFISKEMWNAYMDVVNSQGPYKLTSDQKSTNMHFTGDAYWAFKRNFSTGILNIENMGFMPTNSINNLLVSSQYQGMETIAKMLAKIYNPGLDTSGKNFHADYITTMRQTENTKIFDAKFLEYLDNLRKRVEDEHSADPTLARMRAALQRASIRAYNMYFNLEF
jgi:hypothetical protein